MHKYFSVFLLFLFSSFRLLAQDSTVMDQSWTAMDTSKFSSTGYMGVNYGLIYTQEYLGLKSLNIAGAYPIKKSHYGISGKLGFGTESYPYGSQPLVGNYYALVGGYITFQLSKNYAFDIKIMGGAVYSPYPAVYYSTTKDYSYQRGPVITDSTINFNSAVQPYHAVTWAAQGGIGFRYMIAANLGLQINVDYSVRTVLYEQISSTTNSSTVTTYNEYTQARNTLNYSIPAVISYSTSIYKSAQEFAVISIGIYYQLGKAVLIP